MTTPRCPCRSADAAALAYAACCGRYHAGPLQFAAPDAEALMRSRYSAFVLDLTDYLQATWHPRTRPASVEPNPPGLIWLGLEVRRHISQDADLATVEFVARSKLGGRATRHHETSRFVREDGRWLYVEGVEGKVDGATRPAGQQLQVPPTFPASRRSRTAGSQSTPPLFDQAITKPTESR